jgi:hypothetical protein
MAPPPSFTPINASCPQSNPPAATASLVSLAIAAESMLSGADTAQSTQATQATQTTRTRTPDSGGPSPKPDPVTIHYSELIGKSRVALAGAASLRELEKLPVRTCPMHWQPKVSGWGWDRCANRRKQRKRKLELNPSMKWQRGILRTTISSRLGTARRPLCTSKAPLSSPPATAAPEEVARS